MQHRCQRHTKCTRLTSQEISLGPRSLARVVRKGHSWLNTSTVLLVVDVATLNLSERTNNGHSPTMAITHLTKMRTPIIIVRTISTMNTPGI